MATAGPKITSDMIRSFNGEGDVCAWVQKVELVGKLTKVKDMAAFLPLYLEGNALAVYLELSDEEKDSSDIIIQKLIEAFSDSRFTAYNKLKVSRWTGEPVDVFANDIRRLARESGLKGDGLEQVVKLAFITGFPEDISSELQQIPGVDDMHVSGVLGRARILATRAGSRSHSVIATSLKEGNGSKGEKVKCFKCNGPHLIRDCPDRERIVCYKCGKEGHIARRCWKQQNQGIKDESTNTCAGVKTKMSVARLKSVPLIEVKIKGRRHQAMVDTGCTMSLIRSSIVSRWSGESTMVAFDGRTVKCKGVAEVSLDVAGIDITSLFTVVDNIVGNVDVVVGMDVIEQLGGVLICGDRVQFGNLNCSVKCEFRTDCHCERICDQDFEAVFDGTKWTVRYYWEGDAPRLTNKVAQYDHTFTQEKEDTYNAELQRWIDEEILVPWEGEVEGIIPIMAVEQATKNKIRPVLDFRQLNKYVRCHTGGDAIDVCGDRLREWRRIDGEAEVVDLKSAYLQIHVAQDMWKHQLVEVNGVVYALTRLGFGLNVAPKIMSRILKFVLATNEEVKKATSSYIDDIMVDVTTISAQDVVGHLKEYGLVAKDPEKLNEGAVLGLRLKRDRNGDLMFSRANEVPTVEQLDANLTKREVFSLCGKLVGHYPIAGWLRIACSFVKRQTEGTGWDDYAGDKACRLLREVVMQVQSEDPVKGSWKVSKETKGVVWCDASDLALGAMVEIGGVVVEDAAWLRKKEDFNHINVAELESALKGVNLGVQWGLKDIKLMTDSATVYGWIVNTLSEDKKVKTKGAAEILVKRRLGVLKCLVEELELRIEVICIASSSNKADKLTRVQRQWLIDNGNGGQTVCCAISRSEVKALHEQHHFGVERTWYLAKQVDPTVSKEAVKHVVRHCARCQSIDPASRCHDPGELGIKENWSRLAIDVCHFRGIPYLTMVDCGPGRFALWRELRNETACAVCRELEQVFRERGPVTEVLMDNATVFRSQEMCDLLQRWNVYPFFRAAYRPSGNGIVERHHRTIKSIAERGQISPTEAVYWYNSSPRDRQKEDTIPHRSIFNYTWRHPDVVPPRRDCVEEESRLCVGDEVWVKPASAKCTTQWGKGRVSKINSMTNVEIDGMPRHVLDVRPVILEDEDLEDEDCLDDESARDDRNPQVDDQQYIQRVRRAPQWVHDYVMY